MCRYTLLTHLLGLMQHMMMLIIIMRMIFVVSIVVDPRFKLAPFDCERTRRKAADAIIALLESEHGSTSTKADLDTASQHATSTSGPSSRNTAPPAQTHSSTSDIAGTSSFVPASHSAHQQLDAYISEPNIPCADCPLSWWSDNWQRYPLIAEVARRLLVVPATAVSTKRLYTKESEATMDKRNAVSPSEAEQVLFIMENL